MPGNNSSIVIIYMTADSDVAPYDLEIKDKQTVVRIQSRMQSQMHNAQWCTPGSYLHWQPIRSISGHSRGMIFLMFKMLEKEMTYYSVNRNLLNETLIRSYVFDGDSTGKLQVNVRSE